MSLVLVSVTGKAPGQIIAGRFKIISLLGKGGMASNRILYVSQLLPRLRGSQALTQLRMANSGLVDTDLKIVSQIPKLTFLDLRGNSISDRGVQELTKLQNLQQDIADFIRDDTAKTSEFCPREELSVESGLKSVLCALWR